MGKIYHSLTELIGNTPLIEPARIAREAGLVGRLLVKAEAFNPGGSIKDRAAAAMIAEAEECGRLSPGGIIVEPTSGNTGIGLAWIAAVKGYRAIFTMPETMSVERRNLLRMLGAEIVLTPGSEGMKGAIARAREIVAATPGAFMPSQFDNPANPRAHEQTTAQEIWRDTDGKVDVLVAGVGTGGTISGTGRAMRKLNPYLEVVAVEPEGSPVLSGGAPGPHAIQGIGAGFVPANYDVSLANRIVTVGNREAIDASRLLARREGLLCGISSGATFHAAMTLAKQPDYSGKTIVAILPDTGERYLSTALYNFD